MVKKSTPSMKRLMIINSAHDRHGKSTALRRLRKDLLHLVEVKKGFCDWSGNSDIKEAKDGMFLFQIKGVVIVMCSWGDSAELISRGVKTAAEWCDKYSECCHMSKDGKHYMPDIYITATRPCKHLHEMLASYAKDNGYQQVIKTHECWCDAREELITKANDRYAKEIMRIIRDFIKTMK